MLRKKKKFHRNWIHRGESWDRFLIMRLYRLRTTQICQPRDRSCTSTYKYMFTYTFKLRCQLILRALLKEDYPLRFKQLGRKNTSKEDEVGRVWGQPILAGSILGYDESEVQETERAFPRHAKETRGHLHTRTTTTSGSLQPTRPLVIHTTRWESQHVTAWL